MNEIKPGLFAVTDTMPCLPSQIGICRWALPSTLDRAEPEEAAARILSFSKELDQWVGVSWRTLGEMMRGELDLYMSIEDTRKHNWDEEERVKSVLARYDRACSLTLGFYRRFVAPPNAEPQLRDIPDKSKIPFSLIFLQGGGKVIEGIQELIARGYLTFVKVGEGENESDVFMPTPSLIERIMLKQGIVAAQ